MPFCRIFGKEYEEMEHVAVQMILCRSSLWLIIMSMLFVPGMLRAAARHQETHLPNIVFILADDQRSDTIRALGNTNIQTPSLDHLVDHGTVFLNAITAVPICVASRAEILTGRDGLNNGKQDAGDSPYVHAVAWGSALAQAGYDTCYVGKWHTKGRPSDFGYVKAKGLFGSGGSAFPLTYARDWKGMDVTGYRGWVFQTDDKKLFPERGVGLLPDISQDFADAAIDFISSNQDEPFFLHVNFTAPHDPLFFPTGWNAVEFDRPPTPPNFRPEHPFDHGNFQGRDEKLFHWPRTEDETQSGLAVYYAVIEHLDQQVGRILESLRATNKLANTVIIYSSDHGLAMGSHGLRGKQNMYEHSIGVPLIFYGAGIPARQVCTTPCYLRDLYPTTCELAGIDIPVTVQGKSLKPAFEDHTAHMYDEVFAHFRNSQRMVRTDRWKFICYPIAGKEQLFDLKQDPFERKNLINSSDHAAIAATLRTKLLTWRKSHNDVTLSHEYLAR